MANAGVHSTVLHVLSIPSLAELYMKKEEYIVCERSMYVGEPPPPPHSEGKYSGGGGGNGHRFPPGEGNSFSLLQVNPSWIIPLDDVILAAVGCSYTAPINSIG